MAAGITDKFIKASNGTRPVPTTLSAILASGASPGTATCNALTGWATDTAVAFCIYTTDANNNKVAGSQTDWIGVVSGSTITNCTLMAGTNSGYSVGAIVEASPIAAWADRIAGGLLVEHDQDGTHGTVTAATVATTGSVTAGNGLTLTTGTLTLPSASINQTALPLGAVVQIVSTNYNALVTGTTTTPLDDTIPQITEGNEYMTQAITPKSATNRLLIEATWTGSNTGASQDMTMALFQDATANALAATADFDATAGSRRNIRLAHDMAAGTTSSTTFRIRVGATGAGTTTFCGTGGVRLFGGITLSNIRITEYKA